MRRVALPGAFLATDGLFETFLSVLDGFGAYPAVIERELDRYLPFLATTKVLMAAVRRGVGREQAHEAIKDHAVAVALALRDGAAANDLADRLAADDRLGPRPGHRRRCARRPRRVRRRRAAPGRGRSSARSSRSWPTTPTPPATVRSRSSDGFPPSAPLVRPVCTPERSS